MPSTPTENIGDRPLHESDIPVGTVKQRHIKGLIIFTGVAADLPTDGGTEVQVFFELDTSKLKIWNTVNEAWEESQFS